MHRGFLISNTQRVETASAFHPLTRRDSRAFPRCFPTLTGATFAPAHRMDHFIYLTRLEGSEIWYLSKLPTAIPRGKVTASRESRRKSAGTPVAPSAPGQSS